MMTESAIVTAVDGDVITVKAAIKTTCSSCQAQADCGSGVISRALAPKTQLLTLHSPVPVTVGQEVRIGIPEQGIVTASLLLYVVPLLLLLLSALSLNSILPLVGLSSELWVLMGALMITFSGYVGISGWIKKLDSKRFAPVLLSGSQNTVTIEYPEKAE